MYWIVIIQEEGKDARWALTDVNVTGQFGLNGFQWKIPTPMCVLKFPKMYVHVQQRQFQTIFCVCQPPLCILHELICSFL